MRIQVKDFMSTPVTTALGENTVLEIRELMKEKGIHAIPIISSTNDKLKVEMTIRGIVTSTDINKEINDAIAVSQVMTSSNVHVVHVDSSAQAAAKMMIRYKVHHIVVMDEGVIVGMVSSLDFVKLVAEHSIG
ncbi:CBS domain-containing protein [Psychroserpens ponticola]|uniref:CBS domain-containing protein n=1 Tax=Psychroserpens ponticola TaxID=2932268 RepID=A0ABY7RZ12_9FLAO|nr:CBS domain-containing protein [Psychroserpens ponticola]WCO02113.1 CBS domain-containing protein [Psychroserpens ponticola]